MAVITWPPPHSYGYITRSHNPLRSKQIVKLSFGFTDLAQYTESNTETSHSAMITSSLPRFQFNQWRDRRATEISFETESIWGEDCSPVKVERKLTISVHFTRVGITTLFFNNRYCLKKKQSKKIIIFKFWVVHRQNFPATFLVWL